MKKNVRRNRYKTIAKLVSLQKQQKANMLTDKCWEVSHDGNCMAQTIGTLDECFEIAGLTTEENFKEQGMIALREFREGLIDELELDCRFIELFKLDMDDEKYRKYKSNALNRGFIDLYPYFIVCLPKKAEIEEKIVAKRVREINKEIASLSKRR